MKKAVIFPLVLACFILASSLVLADVNIDNYSIVQQYTPGQNVSGYIVLNFTSLSANATISTNFGQSVPLLNLVEAQNSFTQGNFTYSCNPIDCGQSYATEGSGASSYTFSLPKGQSKTIGFDIPPENSPRSTSQIIFNSFSLNVSSDAPISNNPQLSIYALGEQTPFFTSFDNPAGTFGQSEQFGCYSSSYPGISQTYLTGTLLCEMMYFGVTPDVEIGANITQVSSSAENLEMYIWNQNDSSSYGSCSINSPGSGFYNCTPDTSSGTAYSISAPGYYDVCITDPQNSQYYTINYYQNPNLNAEQCGFSTQSTGIFPGNYTMDVNLFGVCSPRA